MAFSRLILPDSWRVLISLAGALFFSLSPDSSAQQTEAFDTVDNWVAGAAALTSYGNHSYNGTDWSYTSELSIRNSTAAQDGFPGALGVYAWRLRDATGSQLTATFNSEAAISSFGFQVRRWDASPDPAYMVEYSIDTGVTWNNTGTTINNAFLDNSSDWRAFAFNLPAPVAVTPGQFRVRITRTGGERVFVDNFVWTTGTASSDPVITSFEPAVGPVGTPVTINGLNFGASPTVQFNGVAATGVSVNTTGTSITATVPTGATSGSITVGVDGKATAASANSFTVGVPPPALTANPATVTGLNTVEGVASSSFFYTLVASNLTGNLVVAPSNPAFEVSTDDIAFSPSVTVPQVDGSASVTIYVRLAATAPVGAATGTMTNSVEGSGTPFTSTPSLSGSVAGANVGDLVAGWDFQTTTTGGTALAAAPDTPKVINANFGSGTIYADGSNSSSDWFVSASGATNTELNAFRGTAINTAGTDLSTVTALGALAVAGGLNNAANGKSLVFRFSMAGYQNLTISLVAQRSATGFSQQVWEYSTDGSTWSSIGTLAAGATVGMITDAFANGGVLTLPTTSGLNNIENAYVRVTFAGAAASTGNNRIDNIQFRAMEASGPRIAVSPASISSLAAAFPSSGTSQPITVTGAELTAEINVAVASANYQIAEGGSGNFGSSATLPAQGGTIDVRITQGVAIGSVAPAAVTLNSDGAAQRTVTVSGTVTDPNAPSLSINPTSLTVSNTTQGTPSAAKTFTIAAANLPSDVVITPPTGFAVSTDGTTFSTTAITIPVAQFVSPATISVRLTGATQGSPRGSLAVVSGNVSANVAVNGTVGPPPVGPTIVVAPTTLPALTTSQGVASTPQSFNVSGNNLTAGDLTVTAPAGFEISLASGGLYDSTATLTPTSGTLASTAVFVRIAASTPQGALAAQNVTVAGGGAPTQNVSVSGEVTAPAGPTINVSPGSLSGFLAEQGVASSNQVVTVSGALLQGPITMTAPANYEISTNAQTGFADTVVLTPVAPQIVTLANAAPVVIASDDAGVAGYPAGNWPDGANGGIGFQAWKLSGAPGGTGGFAGNFIGSAAIDGVPIANYSALYTSGVAFSIYAGGNNDAFQDAVRSFAQAMQLGDVLTHSMAICFDNGNKGFTLLDGEAEVFFFNANASGYSWSGGGSAPMTPWPGVRQNGVVINFTVTRTSTGFDYSIASAQDANLTRSGSIVASGVTALKYFISGAGGGDGGNLYFNNLQIVSSGGGGGGGGGAVVSATPIYVRVKADAAAANAVGGALTATSPNAATRNVTLSGRVARVTVSKTGLNPFVTTSGTPSATQSFTVSGAGLGTTDISVTAPLGFEISRDGGANYSRDLGISPSAGAVSETTITVRLSANAAGGSTPSGNITVESGPATRAVAVSGTVVPPVPSMVVSPTSLTGFATTVATPSAAKTFTLTGSNLADDVVITPPAGFAVSVDGADFSTAALTVPRQQVGAPLTIYVRLTGVSLGSLSGDISLASRGAQTRKVRVSGVVSVVPAEPLPPLPVDSPLPDAVFTITVAGEPVLVERWGTGSKGVVMFSHSGNLAAELRVLNAEKSPDTGTYFRRALGPNTSLFLWRYPPGLRSRVDKALRAYFNGRVEPSPNFKGVALGVAREIRQKTGLRNLCLVGNSLGAGIILWDYAQLRKDAKISTVLVSPTPIFLPPQWPAAKSFKRALVVLDAENDPFVKGRREKAYLRSLANGPWPRDYDPSAGGPAHFIIGSEVSLEVVGSLVQRAAGKDQRITFLKLPAKRAGDKSFSPVVRSTSKLKVRLTSSNPRVARIVGGNRIQPMRPGTTVIRATQMGDRRWIPAFPVEKRFEVKRKKR